ncbi:hypothetical protein RJ640_017533 [Escallonia rubra]|uniref:Fe2OG dioxygenase domain-containing protein n=1 Tax=Escallonia rubra TaxID=112253 RepID=A0AA88R6A3_9ASTE|nr:hypothetical protein RJ640_017533 [Escallonia rubra]
MADCDAAPALQANEVNDVPVIDLSILSAAYLVAEIRDACENWGVFQVINHGVPLELQAKFELVMKKFFAQPVAEKRKLRKDVDVENPYDYGYEEFVENVDDWKEVFDFPLEKETMMPASTGDGERDMRELIHSWPEYPPNFREACEEYGREMEKLSYRLMELICLSLGVQRQRLNGFFKDHCNMGRIIHCPPCPTPHAALGTHRHTDVGALTVLSQDDVGGLEVLRRDGEWVQVKFIPNAYVVNVGDMLEVWSNKKYQSLVHRAKVNSERERFSVPFFFNPALYVVVEPLEELTDEENHAKYRALHWGKYYGSRKYGNFKNPDMDVLRLNNFMVSE